jgi:hypothetical protein
MPTHAHTAIADHIPLGVYKAMLFLHSYSKHLRIALITGAFAFLQYHRSDSDKTTGPTAIAD